jgi:hypothetical protein
MISNGDSGVVFTFLWDQSYMVVTSGTSATLMSGPQLPGGFTVAPVLQAQDGSFVGTGWPPNGGTMVAFDASGNIRWSVPNEQPQIATDDGRVIGRSGATYDSNGNATGWMNGPITYSWFGNSYQVGSVEQLLARLINLAGTFWPFSQGNASGNGTANKPLSSYVQPLMAQIALSYAVPPKNATFVPQGGLACNLFVKQVLEDCGQTAPVLVDARSRLRYLFGTVTTPYYPALAGDWATRTSVLGCWHNVIPTPRLSGPIYPAQEARPGDVIAETISYGDATGHTGIVVGPGQTASADSAASCKSQGSIPDETIDITSYGFRPDGWSSPETYVNPSGQTVPCSTYGWMSKAVVKRFVCQ